MHIWGIDFSQLFDFAAQLGYWGAAAALFIEGLTIPFPGGTFLLFYGFLASQGKTSLLLAISSASLGYTIACTFPYWLGRVGGRPVLLHYGRYIGFSQKRFEETEQWFSKFGVPIVAFGRLLFFRNYVSYFAGLNQMAPQRFYFYTWLGVTPWVIYMVVLGYVLGSNWRYALTLVDRYSWVGALLIVAMIGMVYWIHQVGIGRRFFNWFAERWSRKNEKQ
ncbi:DedA family protein [Metallumcola ferriviriculae]|uniref:DedA family protein n=1 Tax=Metallumcola ferriviriculae TaxID=3039180 RepID=A0AAU0UQC9_9FIRM|nr:DedA family protein [Desulfitibacteraceae bacterium MK1]